MDVSLLLNYARFFAWPDLEIAGWRLRDKFAWKQFANLASRELLESALKTLQRRYLEMEQVG